MKLIRTEKINGVGVTDISRIAKEMINIYHGCKYFLNNGTVNLSASNDYLEWEVNNITYEYTPVRGYIYLNYAGGLNNPEHKKNLCALLYNKFIELNAWGMRKTVNIDHYAGTNQFTMEREEADGFPNEFIVAEGAPFNIQYAEYKFSWIINDRASLFQYSAPGKFIDHLTMIASASTIVVDVAHTELNINDGYRVIGFPSLIKDIRKITSVIYLSRILGIDGHLYHRIGGPTPISKCGDSFIALTRAIQKDPAIKQKVHIVKSLGELKHQTHPKDSGDQCTICHINVFDKYYQVSENSQFAIVCRFCAHFNTKVATELNTGKYKIYIGMGPPTLDIIESAPMVKLERDVIRALYMEILQNTLQFIRPQINSELGVINQIGGLVIDGEKKIVGIQTGKICNLILERIHKFPDHTLIFEYMQCWN